MSRKSLKCLELIAGTRGPPKRQIWTVVPQNCKQSAVKCSMEKLILLNFMKWLLTFCPRFSEETYANSVLKAFSIAVGQYL